MKPLMLERPKLYPVVDPRELEPQFGQHMLAMTAERLDSKAAIAEQLAWRDKRIAELENQLSRQTPFALDWRDALEGIAHDLGMPPGTSLAADVRPAFQRRVLALETVALEAVAMLSETNHGGLSYERSESMRLALEAAGISVSATLPP